MNAIDQIDADIAAAKERLENLRKTRGELILHLAPHQKGDIFFHNVRGKRRLIKVIRIEACPVRQTVYVWYVRQTNTSDTNVVWSQSMANFEANLLKATA
jgi:hypothetical protein